MITKEMTITKETKDSIVKNSTSTEAKRVEIHDFSSPNLRNHLYRAVFFGFGLIFATLGSIILFKSTNWNFVLFFKNGDYIKEFMCSLTYLLSIGSFLLSYAIKPEHAAADEMTGLYKKNLDRFYKDLKVFHPQQSTFKHFYYETIEKIEDKKEKSIKKLDWIKQASGLSFTTKQSLANQVLSDLQKKLKKVIHNFHANSLSDFN